jgi:mRNA interferase MazF
MTDYKQGDLILVPYPFAERAGGKKRPALVFTSTEYNQATGELVIAQVTSRVSVNAYPGDYHIEGWREANLPRPALVRCRLATVKASLVLRRLGELTDSDLQAVRKSLVAPMLG